MVRRLDRAGAKVYVEVWFWLGLQCGEKAKGLGLVIKARARASDKD